MADPGWKNTLKEWNNKPEHVKAKGNKIVVKVPASTDCKESSNNAPFYWQKCSGDFQVLVKVYGGFSQVGDKGGLMVRLDDENWILTGMEHTGDHVNNATLVCTNHIDDWCMASLPATSAKDGVWFCFKRMGNSYECYYSLDARKWVQTRQGTFTERPVLYVGLACACPSQNEFRVTFENYKCSSKVMF